MKTELVAQISRIFLIALVDGIGPMFLLAAPAQAQLSPGELHRAHAFLAGVDNCSKCHSSDRQNLSNQCLKCHTAIRERRDAGKGLHAHPDYRKCQLCHVEHQGRDFNLINFRGGRKAFDHSLTGYVLQGEHAQLECNKCHRQEHLQHPEKLADQAVAPGRTYLGLGTDCLNCHLDRHRGQLNNDCASCHSFNAWQPATGFDHAASRFALTGRHSTVTCEKCHPVLTGEMISGSPQFAKYSPIDHDNCTDCHRDTHDGRLGDNCIRCHSTNDWKQLRTADFDHDRTRYPLSGRHASVTCQKCHTGGSRSEPLQFSRCRDCHTDYHNGTFDHRSQAGACEECHTVEGFRPAVFTLAAHDSTDYPLAGAHKAIPCDRCHRVKSANAHRYVFEFASQRCAACHRDPHNGQVDRWVALDGCEGCHSVDAWQVNSFDHSRTNWPLSGKHRTVACAACHRGRSTDKPDAILASIETNCSSCHRSVHGDQFDSEVPPDDDPCERCHTAESWQPSRFDHTRDARFVLDGAHVTVPCNACHRTETEPETDLVFVRYKPLGSACVSCHGNTVPIRKADS